MASTQTQEITAMLDAASAAAAPSVNSAALFQPWTPDLIRYLVVAVLVFTMISLVLSTLLLWRRNAHGDTVLKVFGIISIVGISAVLLVAGYNNDQLTPIVGLFGAIAGYLLGKEAALPRAGDAHAPTNALSQLKGPAVAPVQAQSLPRPAMPSGRKV